MDMYSLDPRERASLHYGIRNTDGVYPVHYSLKTNKQQPLMLYLIQYCTVYSSFFLMRACTSVFLQFKDTSTLAYRENAVPQTHILLEVQNIH